MENQREWRRVNKEINKEKYKPTIQAYNENNVEKRKNNLRRWKKENIEYVRLYQRIWARKNREAILAKRKVSRVENHDKIRGYAKKWYSLNKEITQERNKKWRIANPEKVRASSLRVMNRYMATPKGKLSHLISKGMRRSFVNGKQGNHWEDLVDFTTSELKIHIENLFTEGMSWDKFLSGEIHIDHKLPISSFHYEKPTDEGFKKCWSLDNLQPLWAMDNFKKGNKILCLNIIREM